MLPMRFAEPHGLLALLSRPRRVLAACLAVGLSLAAFSIAGSARADDEDPAGDESNDDYADTDPSALNDFREPLAPYGTWSEDPTYGTVWVPNTTVVGADFAPYQTAGHWAMSDNDEWMWVSDYDWGHIPFHYGRWVWVGAHWAWIPGRTYAPAWVSWRVGDAGYLGWAPLPPAYYWSGGVAVGLWTVPYAAYCFVPSSYVFYNNVSTYVVRDRAVVQSAAAHTRPYRPASPTVGHGAAPGHNQRMSPSLREAGVSASAAPKARVAPDARAKAYASRSATAQLRGGGHNRFTRNAPSRVPGARPDGGVPRGNVPSRRDAWQGGNGAAGRAHGSQFHAPPPGRGGAGRGSFQTPHASPRGAAGVAPHFAPPAARPSAPAVRPTPPRVAPRSIPHAVGRAVGGRHR